jgi:hypothetical protein
MIFKNPITVEQLLQDDEKFKPVFLHDKLRTITGGFASDLLSHGIDKARKGDAWLTILTNYNMTAPASITDVSCLIICDDIIPTEQLIEKSKLMEINLLRTNYSIFDCAVILNKICKG